MAFTAELERAQTLNAQKIAEEHNAMIKERYRRLQDAEAEQFANSTQDYTAQQTRASVFAPVAPTYVNAPAVEQTPQVTEFVHARVESPVFTTEKFNGMQQAEAVAVAPVAVQPMQVAHYAPAQAVEQETQFAFTPMAKKICIAFAATVTVMLSVIGINTGIIKRNETRIQDLERQEQALRLKNEDLDRRIEEATSEETIIQYAQDKGMIKG
ncbi:MAG: hypothetical protein E7368_00085 [Clostridiales bacterium]|nr:hypothetical protein [Clostridiales bacterium]